MSNSCLFQSLVISILCQGMSSNILKQLTDSSLFFFFFSKLFLLVFVELILDSHWKHCTELGTRSCGLAVLNVQNETMKC